MTWRFEKATVTPSEVFELLHTHKMELRDPLDTAAACRGLAEATGFRLLDDDDVLMGTLFISADGGVDFFPKVKYFGHRETFAPKFKAAVAPVLDEFMAGEHARLYSTVPVSRNRTKKALTSVGFKITGKPRKAFIPFGGEPEDVWVLDLLPEDRSK